MRGVGLHTTDQCKTRAERNLSNRVEGNSEDVNDPRQRRRSQKRGGRDAHAAVEDSTARDLEDEWEH